MKNVSKSPLSTKPLSFQITEDVLEVLDERVKKIVNEAITEAFKALKPKSSYLTRREVCDRLRITYPTTYALSKRGILTPHKVGYRILFDEAEVDATVNRS